MKVWKKVTLGVLGVVLGGIVLAFLGFWGIGHGLCGNEVLADVPAPDNRHRAVVFQRDCGATTGVSTQVSIIRGSRRLSNEAGNTFVADADPSRPPTGQDEGLFVEARWTNGAQLNIYHDTRARIFTADSLVEGIRIRFLTRPYIPRRRAHN